jgi:Xaa-Pro aminopeptidase
MNERVNTPISTAELERRWALVRAAMKTHGIDVLLMQANNDFMGGYVKWFTDVPATNGYPVTVIFPREAPMHVIAQGAFGLVRELPPEGDGVRRGVSHVYGSPSYASAGYTAAADAALAEAALAPYAGGTIGVLGRMSISMATIEDLKAGTLAGARWVDFSDTVDRIKTVKSREEIDLMRATARMQDACWQAVLEAIRPGMRDIEIAGIAEQAGRRLGSEQGLFLCASAPVGVSAMFGNRHLQNRVIEKGDYITLLIESSGAGGYYTEIGRTAVLGRASQEMQDEYAVVLEARQFTLDRLKPGADGKSVWDAYNGFLRGRGRPEEKRLHCHGQGYDMVERPLVRFDETMTLGADMVLACHPTWATQGTFSWICDNYLIGQTGVVERFHQTEEKIFEIV